MGWRYQIPLLVDMGFRVVAPDMMGYGGTVSLSRHSYHHHVYLLYMHTCFKTWLISSIIGCTQSATKLDPFVWTEESIR
jgi:hypothetical protein